MPKSNEADFWLTSHHFISSNIHCAILREGLREMQVLSRENEGR